MSDTVREAQSRTPFDPLDGEALAQAILTRRRRKCIAEGGHVEDCPRCGQEVAHARHPPTTRERCGQRTQDAGYTANRKRQRFKPQTKTTEPPSSGSFYCPDWGHMFTRITLCLIAVLSLAFAFTGDMNPDQQIIRMGIAILVLAEGLHFLVTARGQR